MTEALQLADVLLAYVTLVMLAVGLAYEVVRRTGGQGPTGSAGAN